MLTFLLIDRDGNNLVGWLHIKKSVISNGEMMGFFSVCGLVFFSVFHQQGPRIIIFHYFSIFLPEVIIFPQIIVLLTCKFICLEGKGRREECIQTHR